MIKAKWAEGTPVPKFRINAETNEWEVSYDEGYTWISLGVKATGNDGQDGKDGTDGKDGKDGTDGQNGQDGRDGHDGKDGIGIANVALNDAGELIITFTDGTEKNLGKISGAENHGRRHGRRLRCVACRLAVQHWL